VKIWHPNYSGMQFNQLTRSEIPAEYIENVQLYVEDKLTWEYNGTIGIAQDVFFLMPIHTEGKHVVVYARDNLGNEFTYDNIN
jgi:sulfur-oxidizing protein SoxY